MSRAWFQFISALLYMVALLLVTGCERAPAPEALVLKVGVIASLSGQGQHYGEVTVNCARVIANYYNEQGGVEVEGDRYRVELVVRDDASDASQAAEIAYDFAQAGDVHYVIGPEGSSVCEAVAPVLDSAGILYLHYGHSQRLLTGSSHGFLARHKGIPLFTRVVDYLDGNEELRSICVLVSDARTAMNQKLKIEALLEQRGFDVVRFARFDVSEAIFNVSHTPAVVQAFVAQVVSSDPDVVVLCGQPRGTLPAAMSYLRGGGYTGLVIAGDSQALYGSELPGTLGGDLLLVGSSVPAEERSDYYLEIQDRYLDQYSEWDADVDVKLYALESVLRAVAHCGRGALNSSEVLMEAIETIQFENPFIVERPLMGFQQRSSSATYHELSIPILLSKYSEGELAVVYRSYFPIDN